MKKQILALSWLAWSMAAILSPASAQALAGILGLDDVIEVIVTPRYQAVLSTLHCNGYDRYFNYKQLMAVPGEGAIWVATDFIYGTGLKQATLVDVCVNEAGETVYVYGLDSCQC